MSTMRLRWLAAMLVLLALIPADLAVARLALRHDLAATATGAARAGVHAVADAGFELLGRGVHTLGGALIDGACRVADAAGGFAPRRMGATGRGAIPTGTIACRVMACDEASAALRAASRQQRLERAALERARVTLGAEQARLEASRGRMEAARIREQLLRLERIESRLELGRTRVKVVMVVDGTASGSTWPLPAPALATPPAPAIAPRTGS